MSLFLVLALGAAVFNTAFGLISRVLAVKSENPLAFSFVYGLCASLIATFFFIGFSGQFRDLSLSVILVTILAIIFYAIFEITQFFTRKRIEASYSTILFQLSPIITFAGSVIFLGESAGIIKILGISLIILGNLVVIFKNPGKPDSKALPLALATVFSLGAAYVADKFVISHYPLNFYLIISYLGPTLLVLLVLSRTPGFISAIKHEIKNAAWKLPLLSLVSVTGYSMALRAFSMGEVSIATPIIFTSTILTAIGGVVVLKEKSGISRKIIGAALAFAGILLLNLY